jgi:hypothetical protein
MGGVLAWFTSTLIIAANIHKHRADIVSAQKAAAMAEDEKNNADRLRIEAEQRLAKAEARIHELEPKPFKERVLTFGASIDLAFPDLISSGTRIFRMDLDAVQFGQLQSLANEDSRISVATSTNTRLGPAGPIIEATLQIGDGVFP